MKLRMSSHAWVLLSIVILAIATTVALTRLQNNFDAHNSIDRASCHRALKNREILHGAIQALVKDPGGRSAGTQATLAGLDRELATLIAQAHSCE